MKLKVLMLFSLMLILVGCSKDKDSDLNVLRAMVLEANSETFLVESSESSYSGRLMVLSKGNELAIKPGYEIDIYYKGEIVPGSPAEILEPKKFEIIDTRNAEDEVNASNVEKENSTSKAKESDSEKNSESSGSKKENKEFSGVKNKYFDYPILSTSKNGNKREMKNNESALVHELIDIVKWEAGAKEIKADYIIYDEDQEKLEFDSKTGILNNVDSDIHIKLPSELKRVLLLALDGDL